MTSPTLRCADAARDRADPPLGTAPVAGSFLLIEHPGPWRSDALAGAGWSSEVVDALTAALAAVVARVPGDDEPRLLQTIIQRSARPAHHAIVAAGRVFP